MNIWESAKREKKSFNTLFFVGMNVNSIATKYGVLKKFAKKILRIHRFLMKESFWLTK